MINSGSRSKNQNTTYLSSEEAEISLFDILHFLKSAYKIIVISSVVGFSCAVIYLNITPKQYEAVAQIAIAQINITHQNSNSNSNNVGPLSVNIEDPQLLITRLGQPTSFTPQVLVACKVDGGDSPREALAKSIKLSQPKGVSNLVEVKTFATSPQDAQSCAQAIFELIKTTQAQIVAPYIENAKTRLAEDERRLLEAKNLLAKADKSGLAMGAAYLATRDEIRFLLDEIATLNNVIASSQMKAVRLISPIYASDAPIAPKRRIVLAGGILGGLLFGLMLALTRQTIAKLETGLARGSL